MKKIISFACAAVAVIACNKAEVIDVARNSAISFDAPFIENSTKAIDPSFTASTLTEFKVYGTMTNASNEVANIFNAVPVTKGNTSNHGTPDAIYGTWGYDAQYVQYWVSGNSYAFAAVAGVEGVTINAPEANNNMPSTILYDASTQTDLLYAVNAKGIYDSGDATNIAFDFKHLLSKAKFTFSNAYPEGFTVTVTNVSITNAYASGTYTVAIPSWAVESATESLDFGAVVASDADAVSVAVAIAAGGSAVSNYERLLIPAEYAALGIQYSYYVTSKEGLVVKTVEEATANVAVTLEAGHSYNFKAEIADVLKPITFSVEKLTGWDSTGGDKTVTL